MGIWQPSLPVLLVSSCITVGGGLVLLKSYSNGNVYDKELKATNKVVIVTGANTGIGKETAKDLARRGANVTMACRNMAKCEQARQEIVVQTQNKYVYCRKCDLASQESIQEFVKQFKKENKRLDILINNAGVMRCPFTRTKEGIEMQLGVNHMGHFLLTNLLLDYLKDSSPSRIINLSSLTHTRGKITIDDLNSEKNYDPGAAYCQSKLANILFTRELSKRLEGSGVTVNSVHPGTVNTEITRHMGSLYLLEFLASPFLKSKFHGAQTTMYAALDPSLEKVSGVFFSDSKEHSISEAAKDDKLAQWLWAVSEKWTRLHDRANEIGFK